MKTVSWSKLPNEILLNILQRNDNNTNSQCSLTCRDWKYPAQCALFEKIAISNNEKWIKLSNAISIIQSKSNGAYFGQSPGNYVKIVSCRSIGDLIDWELLDKMFPFLEVIKTSEYTILDHTNIYRLLKEGKFQHLKILPTDQSNQTPPELLLARREKIEELELFTSSREDEILQNLHLFPNLKLLYLEYKPQVHLEHFFSKKMLHIKSMAIEFFCDSRTIDTSDLDMDDIRPFSNTKELMIEHSGFTYYDKFILYIMKKFPNIESLVLNDYLLGPVIRNDGNVFPTIDCAFQFLVYLSKIKSHSYANMITNKFTIQLVKKFLNYVIDPQTVYYKNKNITLGISFKIVHIQQEHDHPPDITEYILIENRNPGSYKKNECYLTVTYRIMEENTFQSQLQLFREVGNMNITCLRISSNNSVRSAHSSSINLSDFSSTIHVVFDEIFSHFSKLENLEISEVSDFTWNKEKRLVAETLNSTIKYMKYTRCTLSKDIFPMISKRCTNLKTLNLINCRYNNNNEDQAIPHYFPIVMPSTCLKELMINFSSTNNFEYKKVFIRLITNNKKPRYCKITTETGSSIVSFQEQDFTEAHYNMCLHNEECGVFDIRCEAVVKLTVQFQTNDCEVYDYNWFNEKFDDEEEDSVFWKIKEYLEEDL